MALYLTKFSSVFVFILMASYGDVNGQILAIGSGFQQTISLLENVTDTSSTMSGILMHLVSILERQQETLVGQQDTMNTMVSILEKQQGTLEELLKTQTLCCNNTPEADDIVRTTEAPSLTAIKDCSELTPREQYPSGIYRISLSESLSFDAYCNMDADGGGWTVFQKRFDGTIDFYRNWDNYTHGFGNLEGELWLGLQNTHLIMTTQQSWELLILIQDFNDETAYAKYDTFYIGDAASNYRLTIAGYSGTAGDSILPADHPLNGRSFSTYDRSYDDYGGNCPSARQGAWWYRRCTDSNLNGRYLGTTGDGFTAMYWYYWKNSYQSLKASTMMMRPRQ